MSWGTSHVYAALTIVDADLIKVAGVAVIAISQPFAANSVGLSSDTSKRICLAVTGEATSIQTSNTEETVNRLLMSHSFRVGENANAGTMY